MTEKDPYAPRPIPKRLSVEPARKPPTLQFTYDLSEPQEKALITVPYGFTSFDITDADLDTGLVIGEIHAIDNEHAVVHFVWGDDEDRVAARVPLEYWAERDKWQLEFAPGTHPLTEPDPPVRTHWTPGICNSCRNVLGTGYASHMRWKSECWQHTDCGCGGRLRWYSARRRRKSGGEVDR